MASLNVPLPPRSLAGVRSQLPAALSRATARLTALSLPLGTVVATIAVAGLVGAGLDAARDGAARALFTLLLAGAGGVGALAVRRRDRLGPLVAVPLVYVGLLVVLDVVAHSGALKIWLVDAFIQKAPVVLIATAVTAIATALRARADRRG